MKKFTFLLFVSINTSALPEIELKSSEAIQSSKTKSGETLSPTIQDKLQLTEELIHSPQIIRKMINRAIDTRQFHLLSELNRIYQKTQNPDLILLNYSQAIIYSLEGKYSLAIDLYRKIIAQYPQFHPIRLRLAQVLFEDQQNEAALDQFRKLNSEELPKDIKGLVSSYILSIQKRSDWQVDFGLTYLNESNINNASSEDYIYLGNIPFKKSANDLPKKANGVGYQVNLSKNIHVISNHSLYFENNLNGKSYWDHHDFDDIQNRTSFGYQYQNAKTKWNLLPFYERRWFAGHKYNYGYGIRNEFQHWITPNWQFTFAAEFGQLKHKGENKVIDGNNLLGSTTLLYAFNSLSYLYMGVDRLQENLATRSFSSSRVTTRIGWGEEWWGGISSRIQLSYGKRKFEGMHSLFQTIRKDKEKDFSLTVWHRNLHFMGITPKITFNHHKVKSNLNTLYSYKRNRVYLNFEKSF